MKMGFGFELQGPMLPAATLSPDAERLLQEALANGLLRFWDSNDIGLQLPRRFRISSMLVPAEERLLPMWKRGGEASGTIPMQHAAIEECVRIHIRMASVQEASPIKSVFLSSSFRSASQLDVARSLLKQAFEEKGIHVVIGKPGGSTGALNEVSKAIRRCNLTLLELSEPRPNCLLERGLSLGIRHRATCLFNPQMSGKELLKELEPSLRFSSVISYSFDQKEISSLVSDIIEISKTKPDKVDTLDKDEISGRNIRPPQKDNFLFLYYPKGRKVWDPLRSKIEQDLYKQGISLITIQSAGYMAEIQKIVWCVSLCKYIIVDTTGEESPDLLGSFALGMAYALTSSRQKRGPKVILRIEEGDKARQIDLSLWQEPYRTWSSESDLSQIIKELVSGGS